MQDLFNQALEEAKSLGASYADVRLVDRHKQPIIIRNGHIQDISSTESKGVGVRVMVNGAWGFSACAVINKNNLFATVKEAISIAKASAMVQAEPIELTPLQGVKDKYATPYQKDPFNMDLEEQVEFLMDLDKQLRTNEDVKMAMTRLHAVKQHKLFMSTEGHEIEQDLLETGIALMATAMGNGDVQRRLYQDTVTGGYEFLEEKYEFMNNKGLHEIAQDLSQEASDLLKADTCPIVEGDMILGGQQLALQIHESCGHPIELDRVLGYEASFAGTSFLTPEKQNNFMYGSEHVNLNIDATIPRALGSFGYDDEGVKAQRAQIVEKGLFKDYLTSRETAAKIGQESNGTCLAEGFNNIPMVRMTNVNIEAGDWSLAEIIKDTKYGIFMDGSKSWSLDDKRLNFHFGCEIAYEVKDGEITRMLKNPAYTDMTPHFWGGCDAVANASEWHVWGLPSCAKGEPMQIAHVGHGSAPARFKNIKMGVGH
ncbi:TldD/PmbA family protein [Clostridium sp. 'deep sea']|uniref:TldD/PmbA family protein n=1 Tax=Clostridium sp. 'deep sea' TaxID=2779445 RepID=UPI0018963EF0|nr:TldD/PmbA family protein [Clostridium sp. 'deep sea']QOR34069.1 TldD/PmbA family protein [Clostridium sp. 'deep sea']